MKRLFFAFEVGAPWPSLLPTGRLLDEHQRHLTVAFLGQVDDTLLQTQLPQIPTLPFKVGLTGVFDKCLFLPERMPRVVAWHVNWLEGQEFLLPYQKQLIIWLQGLGFHPDVQKEFLPHVTLARAPFNIHPWEKSFETLPMLIRALHLYESLGGLHYEPLWTENLLPPFLEIEHTADVAFLIHAESLEQLQLHALVALAFKYPPLIESWNRMPKPESLDDLIIHLNQCVTEVDAKRGCPFKAVSFHGDLETLQNGALRWEMIVDV